MPNGRKIRIALAGIGNCGSSLVQLLLGQVPPETNSRFHGVYWPTSAPTEDEDFEIVAAFDVDAQKVGRDLSEGIRAPANCTPIFRDVPSTGVTIQKGPALDGLEGPLAERIREDASPDVDVARVLRDTDADVLINVLPTGAKRATETYARAAIEAKCGFVNCIPIRIATDPAWGRRFEHAGVPVFGDDLKSQIGTTSVHQALVDLIQGKGGRITKTYQMNIGGNNDFLNMTDGARRAFKNVTKTSAVQRHVDGLDIPDIGPNGYARELRDNKRAHVMIEAELALGMCVEMNLNLSVQDSPNAAGVMLPAILECARARRSGLGGPCREVSDALFKMPTPPEERLGGV